MSCSKRSSSSSLSSSAIIEGNEDLLYEILILLPPKTLIKFKAVSPRWRSLISAPTFCLRHALHHHRRDTQHSLLIQSQEGPNYLVSSCTNPRLFPRQFPLDDLPTVRVRRSCNGLLLLSDTTNSDPDHRRFYVLNPTTSEMRRLAPLPRDKDDDVESIYLIFDPSLSSHYKVVCFVGPTYIYSSETETWQRIEVEKRCMRRFDNGVHFNGGVCFLPLTFISSSSSHFLPDGRVCAFPSPPQIMPEGGVKNYAMESNGVLFQVSLCREGTYCNYVYVFEMKEIESGWGEGYWNYLNRVLRACGGGDCGAMDLIGVFKVEEYLWLVLRMNGKIVMYRISDGVLEVVVDYSSQEFVQETEEWHLFIHTLAPL